LGLESDGDLFYNPSTGTISATALDISGNIDIDGTTNLDAVDIDGAVQLDATLTVGANDQGYDVILYGDTASANVTWDTSADDLIFNGAAGLIVPDGQLTLGSTAVTSTAAELNLLDGVSGLVQADLTKLAAVDATAAEINLIDGGTSTGTTALADNDGIIINDDGVMRLTAVQTVRTYMQVGAGLPAGTVMVFFQAAAPTGWTKSTSNNNKALRVVSGDGGGTGGSAAFASPAHNLSAGAHTLALNEIPSHSHTVPVAANTNGGSWRANNGSNAAGINTSSAGGGASHAHSLSGSITTPQYIDVIVAAKD
jgi:hypothetical protein